MKKFITGFLLAGALALPLSASSLDGFDYGPPSTPLTVLELNIFGGTVEYGPLPYEDWFTLGIIYVDFSTPADTEKVVFFNTGGWSICVVGSCPTGPVFPVPSFTPVFTSPPAATPEPATWLLFAAGIILCMFRRRWCPRE